MSTLLLIFLVLFSTPAFAAESLQFSDPPQPEVSVEKVKDVKKNPEEKDPAAEFMKNESLAPVVATAKETKAVLVGYWSFDKANGDDKSKSENDGVLTGTAGFAEGISGKALQLNGDGGLKVLNSPSLNSFPDGFTMSAWIKSEAYPDFTTIFFKTDRNNRVHMLHFQVDGRLHAAMNQEEPSGGFQGFSPVVVPLNEWHHVAWTYDNKNMKSSGNRLRFLVTA